MAFIYYPQVDEFMQQRVENYNPNSTEADDIFNKEFVDQLQNSFQCCGWKGLEDFGGIFMSIDGLNLVRSTFIKYYLHLFR